MDGEAEDIVNRMLEPEFSDEDVRDVVASAMGPEALATYVRQHGDQSQMVDLKTFTWYRENGNTKVHAKIVQGAIKGAVPGLSDGPRYKLWIHVWVIDNTVTTWEKVFLQSDVPLMQRPVANMEFAKAMNMIAYYVVSSTDPKPAAELPPLITQTIDAHTVK